MSKGLPTYKHESMGRDNIELLRGDLQQERVSSRVEAHISRIMKSPRKWVHVVKLGNNSKERAVVVNQICHILDLLGVKYESPRNTYKVRVL